MLTPAGEEVLRAVAPVVLGPLVDAGAPAGERALDEALAAVDDYLAYLSAPLQREARAAFALLASPPVRVALLRSGRRWREVSPLRVEAALATLQDSPVPALRRVRDFLHALVVVGWFDLPVAWEEIGYPGPPAESAVVHGTAL